MAAFFGDKPLVAGVNEDWDEHTQGTQIMNENNTPSTSNIFRYTTPRKARLPSANT